MIESQISALRTRFIEEGGMAPSDFDALTAACGDSPDSRRLERLLKRRHLGEPLAYVAGFVDFRGRRFSIDKRVYITDPELTHLVDAVVTRGLDLLSDLGRPPIIAEFGVGCGSLAISVKKELPEARVIGLDLDGDAIAVAGMNARAHHADVWLIESDFFADLPPEVMPDIVFGDPPWGDERSIYDEGRPASHYQAMPPLSAFPTGGITGLHEALLERIAHARWSCDVLLNLGTLDDQHIDRLGAMTAWHEIFRFDNVSILHCKMVKLP